MLKPNKKKVIKANDMNGKESDLESLVLKFKKWIEGSAQSGIYFRGTAAQAGY